MKFPEIGLLRKKPENGTIPSRGNPVKSIRVLIPEVKSELAQQQWMSSTDFLAGEVDPHRTKQLQETLSSLEAQLPENRFERGLKILADEKRRELRKLPERLPKEEKKAA